MNSPNYDPNVLIPDGENPPATSPELPQDPSAMFSSTVRQNIAEEARLNLNFSFKYNAVALLISIAKLVFSVLILLHAKDVCFGAKKIWIVCMMVYDICYMGLVIVTLRHMLALNRVIRRNTIALNFNDAGYLNNHAENLSPRQRQSSESSFENEDVREYDVEQSHRYHRVASFSSNIAKTRRNITKTTKFFHGIYFVVLVAGQILYFLANEPGCETLAMNKLMLIFIIMGYVWLLTPIILLFLGCLCVPVLYVLIFFFTTGNQGSSKADISKLQTKIYSHDMPGNKECVICMLEYYDGDKVIQLDCSSKHYFHEECLKRWFKINGHCPVCKTKVGLKKSHSISSDEHNSSL